MLTILMLLFDLVSQVITYKWHEEQGKVDAIVDSISLIKLLESK